MSEEMRGRRTSYRSGRLELLGYERPRNSTLRHRKKSKGASLFGTGYGGNFRWKNS